MKRAYTHYKITLLSLCIIFCSYIVSAQTELKGTVTDATTNTGIEKVYVFIPELQLTAITAADGSFSFPVPGKGIVTLQTAKLGYRTNVQTVDLSAAQSLSIKLEATAMELEEVVVTSNNAKLTDDIPYKVDVFSLKTLKQSSGISMMKDLTYQPGVDQISYGNGIGKPVIRGLSFNQLLLYSNGTRIENQQWDDRHDLGIGESGVDKVEIVKGPAALIYGANALGGALIFTDENPAPAGKTTADVGITGFSNTFGINGDVGLQMTGKKGLFLLARVAAQSHSDYYQGGADSVSEEGLRAGNSRFNTLSGKLAVGISKKWGVSKLTYKYYQQVLGITEFEGADTAKAGKEEEDEDHPRDLEVPYQNIRSQLVSSENTFLIGKGKLNINVAYQNNHREEWEPKTDSTKELGVGLNLNAVTFDAKYSTNENKPLGLTIGGQGMILSSENFGNEILVPNADVANFAGYLVGRYDIKDKLNLLAGVRFDVYHIELNTHDPDAPANGAIDSGEIPRKPEYNFINLERNYSPFSASLGAVYHFSKDIYLKANAATGFSAPNYQELGVYGRHEGTYRFEQGNPDLKMEQNVEGDLALNYEGDFLSLEIAGFYNMINNYIYLRNTGDTIKPPSYVDDPSHLPIYDFVQHNAQFIGGDAQVDIHPKAAKWIDLSSSYSLVRGTLTSDKSNLPWIPADKIITQLKLQKEKMGALNQPYISIVMSNYMKQDKVALYETATPAYNLFDARIGSTFKFANQKLMVAVFCTNLLDERYYDHLSLLKSVPIAATNGTAVVYNMGRNIGIDVRWLIGK